MGTGGDACGFWLFGVKDALLPHHQTDQSFRHQCRIKFYRCAFLHGGSVGLALETEDHKFYRILEELFLPRVMWWNWS